MFVVFRPSKTKPDRCKNSFNNFVNMKRLPISNTKIDGASLNARKMLCRKWCTESEIFFCDELLVYFHKVVDKSTERILII